MNALYDVFVASRRNNSDGGTSSTQRSRSPPRTPGQGIHQQPQLGLEELTGLDGIGSRLVMSRGWQVGDRLGRDSGGSGSGIATALENDRRAGIRTGIGFGTADDPGSEVARAFPNPADDPRINRELCGICLEEFGTSALVEYCCTHSFHVVCDNALVASEIDGWGTPETARCPLCRAPRAVMDIVALSPATGAPAFNRAVAVGSPDTWGWLQLHTRLPSFAVCRNPNVRDVAEPWIRSFLRQRTIGVETVTTLEDAFTSFTVEDDIMGGCMVVAPLKDSWKKNQPRGQDAYHGTHVAAVFAIIIDGLQPGPSSKQAPKPELKLTALLCALCDHPRN